MEKTNITIFGAGRGIGQRFLDMALAAGCSVTALVRSRERFHEQREAPLPLRGQLELIEGDAMDEGAVTRAVRGADAVVVALGAPAMSRSKVRSEGTRQIVAAMKRCGVDRLLAVSVLGAGESITYVPFWIRYLLFPLYLRRVVNEHSVQEELIEGSGLRWTIVRPPTLTDGDRTDGYALAEGDEVRGLRMEVSRADVAGFLMKELREPRFVSRAVGIALPKRGFEVQAGLVE